MQRWDGLAQVPPGFGPSVVTLGNFDGVHLGHQSVLADVVARARLRGAAAVAVTFEPHPLQVLYPDSAPTPLTGLDHRIELLGRTGLDATLVMEFTRELATWSPEDFVRRVFAEALSAVEVVVGRDVRFGHRNAGDLATMRELGAAYGFAVTAMDDLGTSDGDVEGGRRWSSTWARELIAEGDVAGAARILGRPHRVDGIVVHGDHRGRELGYPTANLDPHPTGVVPADGVYAGWLVRLDRAAGHAPTPGCRRPSRSAPTRPSTAPSAGSRPTSWTAPTSTSTASVWRSSWWPGCARPCASTRSTASWSRWPTTSSAPGSCSAASDGATDRLMHRVMHCPRDCAIRSVGRALVA